MNKINVFIEVGKDGLFAVCTKSNKYHCMILGCGDSVDEAMEDFYECRDELKQMEEAAGRKFPDLEFDFAYDKALPVKTPPARPPRFRNLP